MEKKQILIIDNDENIATLFKEILEGTGKCEVTVELSGIRAFSLVKESKPDLVLLEIMTPNADIDKVVGRIRAEDDTKDIPIVFISAALTSEEVEEFGMIQRGAPIISKPIGVKKLMAAVETSIARRPARERNRNASSGAGRKEPKGEDKRKYQRLNIDGQLSYLGIDEKDTPLEEGVGAFSDISQGGLCLETKTPITSEYVQLATVGLNGELISIKGKVVYSRTGGPGGHRVGVEFCESAGINRRFVTELVRILNLLKRR